MNRIYIGLIIACVYLNVGFYGGNIDIIPSFIGYVLIISGLFSLTKKSKNFSKAIPYAIILAIYFASFFVIDLMAIMGIATISINTIVMYIASVVGFALFVLLLRFTIKGIEDIEINEGCKLGASQLYNRFWMFTGSIIALIFLSKVSYLKFIVFIIVIIFLTMFMVSFNRTRIMYNQHKKLLKV